MARVYSLPLSNGSDALAAFKEELLKDHKEDLIIAIDEAIKQLQEYGFNINQRWKRDALKKLDKELYELRQKCIRLFLYFDGHDFFIILHGFIKKSQQTPKHEIEQAKKEIRRWKEER